MATNNLLPPGTNVSPIQRNSSPFALECTVEVGYGEQLSTFTALKQGEKSGMLFKIASPLMSSENDEK
jgi:hypothetical protein